MIVFPWTVKEWVIDWLRQGALPYLLLLAAYYSTRTIYPSFWGFFRTGDARSTGLYSFVFLLWLCVAWHLWCDGLL